MNNRFRIFICISAFFSCIINTNIHATYTLTDNDVVVEDSIIQSCSYSGGETSIIIPETLDGQTIIGIADKYSREYGVFAEMGLESVTFPSTLKKIGRYAFRLNNITSVDFSLVPELVSIGSEAFYKNKLRSLDFSNNPKLTTIGLSAFSQQTDDENPLTSVNFSNCIALTEIQAAAFSGNEIASLSLASCTALENIQGQAFYGNQLSSISFSSCTALEKIGRYAFYSNELNLINLSACTSMQEISEGAFAENNLTGFSLPVHQTYNYLNWLDDENTIYEGGAFVTDLEKKYWIHVTYSLQDDDVSVTNGVITDCNYSTEITSLTIPKTLKGQTVIGIADNDTEGIFENKGITELIVPPTIEFFGNRAFAGNEIAKIDLSACTQIKRFGKYAFEDNPLNNINLNCAETLELIDDYCFSNSENLYTIDFSNYSALKEIGSYAFHNNRSFNYIKLTNCSSLKSIGNNSFYFSSVQSVDFTGIDSLETIGAEAFYMTHIDSVNLSSLKLLEEIGSMAFASGHLEYVNIDSCESLYKIGRSAFFYSESQSFKYLFLPDITSKSIYFWRDDYGSIFHRGGRVEDLSTAYIMPVYTLTNDDVTVSDGFINSCIDLLPIPDPYVIIPDVLDGQPILGISDGSASGVFQERNIERIYLPSAIRYIGDKAFKGNNISAFTMGGFAELWQIGEEAFADNQLTELSLNAYSLSIIDNYAFAGNNLTEVNFSDATSLQQIRDYAFSNNSISSIDLANATQLSYIGQYAFVNNNFSDFILPTPNIKAYNFQNWRGSNGASYAGGATVNNLNLGYSANLVATGHSVTFNVTDGENPVEMAMVKLSSYGQVPTNQAGVTLFQSVEDNDPNNSNDRHSFEVEAYNFKTYRGYIKMLGENQTIDVVLEQALHNVSLLLSDKNNPIAGIEVDFNGTKYTSNDTGYVFIQDLISGTYSYTISNDSYETINGSVEVVAVDVEKTITLSKLYTVGFNVTDGLNAIDGATIRFDGIDYISDSEGAISIFGLKDGSYPYSVSAGGHIPISDTLTISGDNLVVNIDMVKIYTLTFEISDGMNAIEDAKITFNNSDYYSNQGGLLVLDSLVAGTYQYSISKNGYSTISDSVVLNADFTIKDTIVLVFEVEFYVNDATLPLENVIVNFNGETYITNNAGFVTVPGIPAGSYTYDIAVNGYNEVSGSITVVDENIVESITITTLDVPNSPLQSISVYPNPVSDFLHIEFEKRDSYNIAMYSLTGEILFRKEINKTKEQIDLINFKNGIYILQINTKQSTYFHKIIKE